MNGPRKPASTGRTSAIGQERRNVYAGVWRAIKHAAEHGCWLEVIALSESVIADRLEARIAHLGAQTEGARKVRTASQSATQLLLAPSLSDAERQLLENVRAWSRLRNAAVHGLAKVIDGSSTTWEERRRDTEKAAEAGIHLARTISSWVTRENKFGEKS